ncbi:MAG: NTP transferase domain-containing protein [Bacilli bacterium]|nr:NTP transferase domain-containing protein [Bacilli bacterium]
MNQKKIDILNALYLKKDNFYYLIQKLGESDKNVQELINDGYINQNFTLNLDKCQKYKVKKAIILAAGYGLRMLPINDTIPKALISIKGERLIERLIEQLHAVGVYEIYIVVGYMKEKLEYLQKKYDVKLIVNRFFFSDNNCLSALLACKYMDNAYLLPCDLYFAENPFNYFEYQSWYMLSNKKDVKGYFSITNDKQLVKGKKWFYDAVGLAFIDQYDSKILHNRFQKMIGWCKKCYWEEAIVDHKDLHIKARFINYDSYNEINTFNDLLNIDCESKSLLNNDIKMILDTFDVDIKQLRNIRIMRKGMTNRSFVFTINNKEYLMRIPGSGSEQLIDRKKEYDVYRKINMYNICDPVIYMNQKNGIKITEFLDDARNCDSLSDNDLKKCMIMLKYFHDKNIGVDFKFDLFSKILEYEQLRQDKSIFSDYEEVKEDVFSLKSFIEENVSNYTLCHIDPVADNFLMLKDGSVKLIDWEYAAMQDPHLDIAMFALYSFFDKNQTDKLIDMYFNEKVSENIRYKIYAYIAVAGLLWSNWCEFKIRLGNEYYEYANKQYQMAREYLSLVKKFLNKKEKAE